MSVVIEAEALTRSFRTVRREPGGRGLARSILRPEYRVTTAVSDVTFTVARGELLALLGPNGAGKSTTIKMLTGILTPTSGTARVAGVVPHRHREQNARNIGAVFGQRTQLWWDLPARESFRILRDIYAVSEADHRRRLREFDELLDLSSFWDTRVRHLSLGQRVRCDLAAALLHDPTVVFLDEPTIGMDAVVKVQVRELLSREVEQRGRTVLLTTHDMGEVARLADRIVLINHGRVVADSTLAEIKARFGGTWRIHATLAGDAALDTACPPELRILHRDGAAVVFGPGAPGGTNAHQALRRVIERFEIADIRVEENDLEDVMREAYTSPDDTVPRGAEVPA